MAYIAAHQTRSGDATRVQGASQVLREVWQDVGCEPSSRRIRRECGFSAESRLTEHAMDGIGPPGVLVLGRQHISIGAVHMSPDVNYWAQCRIWLWPSRARFNTAKNKTSPVTRPERWIVTIPSSDQWLATIGNHWKTIATNGFGDQKPLKNHC